MNHMNPLTDNITNDNYNKTKHKKMCTSLGLCREPHLEDVVQGSLLLHCHAEAVSNIKQMMELQENNTESGFPLKE